MLEAINLNCYFLDSQIVGLEFVGSRQCWSSGCGLLLEDEHHDSAMAVGGRRLQRAQLLLLLTRGKSDVALKCSTVESLFHITLFGERPPLNLAKGRWGFGPTSWDGTSYVYRSHKVWAKSLLIII